MLLTASALAQIRSAPRINASTSPRAIRKGPAESTASRNGTPSPRSSHAVSRAPCNSGRVSLATTPPSVPRRCSSATTARAVPPVTAASAPVLQWVSSRTDGPQSSVTRSAPSRACPAELAISSSRRRSASASTASGPAASRAAARSAPRARLTAVGRALRTAWIAAVGSGYWRTASATPKAPATPSAGAPRTASRRIASTSSSTVDSRRTRVASGSAVWSMISTAPSTQSMVRTPPTLTLSWLDWAGGRLTRSWTPTPPPGGTCVQDPPKDGPVTARDPGADLREIAFRLERANEASYRVRAFRSAAAAIGKLSADELAQKVAEGTLTKLSGVGDVTARCIAESLAGEEPVYLRRLAATEGTEIDAETEALRRALRGDCHTHSDWSDGGSPIPEMALAAARLGHEYLVLTDHSPRLTVARGLTAERLRRQLEEVAALNDLMPEGFRILTGIEVDILADGSLQQEPELLAELDVVVGSVHSKLADERAVMTERMLAAIANPHLDILGHCTGRRLSTKDGPSAKPTGDRAHRRSPVRKQ